MKIPLLFSDVLIAKGESDASGKMKYLMQTTPDTDIKVVRCSIKGLEPVEDVSIDFTKPLEGQGLGGILNWERKQLSGGV